MTAYNCQRSEIKSLGTKPYAPLKILVLVIFFKEFYLKTLHIFVAV